VRGVVLDAATKRPLFGRTISIGTAHTRSDERGAFELNNASPVYDLTIVDADGATISVYQGLTRRDPVLLHRHSSLGGDAPYSASVVGTLSKENAELLSETDLAVVQFFSAAIDDRILLGGSVPPFAPDYGIFLNWSGASSVSGKLVARGILQPNEGRSADPRQHFFIEQDVTLQDGEMLSSNLTLAPVSTKPLSGMVTVPVGVTLTQLQEYYRLPLPNAVIAINNYIDPSPTFTHEVDELGGTDKQLCVLAASTAKGLLTTERCGLSAGSREASVTLQVAPSLLSPNHGEKLTKRTQFAWSLFEHGVYLLELEAAIPSRSTPNIDLYTVNTSADWPVSTIDPSFSTSYDCTVAGLGPFTSVDDATSAEGLGAIIPRELRRSFSAPLEFATGP
jgi:hypothetical protein